MEEISTFRQKIIVSLKNLLLEEWKKDPVSIGIIDSIERSDDGIEIILKLPVTDRKLQISLEAQLRQYLKKQFQDLGKLKIKFTTDPNFKIETNEKKNTIHNIILVGSGKGGVGKSTVAVNIAATLAKKGYRTGLLDADIYGPSIGKMFGLDGKVPLETDGEKIYPFQKESLKLMSFSFLVDEKQAVVWRGPMLGKALEQFLYDVVWDELDFLIIDLPPGTGDVQLSLAQIAEVTGAIVITTPQKVATLDAGRAIAMFQQVRIPILGIVENMSEFICPHCNKESKIFSDGGGELLAKNTSSSLLGKISLSIDLMASGESGRPYVLHKKENDPICKSYELIVGNLLKALDKK